MRRRVQWGRGEEEGLGHSTLQYLVTNEGHCERNFRTATLANVLPHSIRFEGRARATLMRLITTSERNN